MKKGWRLLLSAALGAVCAYCLLIRIEVCSEYEAMVFTKEGAGALSYLIARIRVLGGAYGITNTLAGVLLTVVFYHTAGLTNVWRGWVGKLVASLIFGVLNVCGMSMASLNSLDFLLANSFQLMVGFVCILAWATVMFAALTWLHKLFEMGTPDCRTIKHPSAAVFGLLMLCWLPYWVLLYPGCINRDTYSELNHAFALVPQTNDHPIVHGWLIAGLMEIGRLIFRADSPAIYLFFLFQTAMLALACATACTTVGRMNVPRGVKIGVVAFFALTPLWGAYGMMGDKDTLFTAAMLGFAAWSLRFLYLKQKPTARALICYGVCGLGMCLFRNAGSALALALAACGVMAVIIKRSNWRLSALLVGVMAATMLVNMVLLPALNVAEGSRRESLSVPFQQVARYVREHGDELTDEQRAIINDVLDVDAITTSYQPMVSDPVKRTYHIDGLPDEGERLQRFMGVWASLLAKHPRSFVEATLANSYEYYAFSEKVFCKSGNYILSLRFGVENGNRFDLGAFDFQAPEALDSVRDVISNVIYLFGSFPPFALLYLQPFYLWLLVGAALWLWRKQAWRALLVAVLPAFVMIGCIASPVNGCFRYFLPAAAIVPLVIAVCFHVSVPQTKPDALQ